MSRELCTYSSHTLAPLDERAAAFGHRVTRAHLSHSVDWSREISLAVYLLRPRCKVATATLRQPTEPVMTSCHSESEGESDAGLPPPSALVRSKRSAPSPQQDAKGADSFSRYIR